MREILTGLLDVLFPPRCPLCDVLLQEHTIPPFCPACQGGIRRISRPCCPRCGLPFATAEGEDHLCGACLTEPPPYALARALGYHEGTLLTAIHRFKYGGRTDIGKALGRMLARFAGSLWEMEAFTRIVPVPLHRKRLRSRGFNQAVILAREVAKGCARPLDLFTLRRISATPPQVELGREARRANVRGAFAVTRPERIAGERILLIDDVFTTGSTLSECTRTLLKAGADSVALLTLARAVPDGNAGAERGAEGASLPA